MRVPPTSCGPRCATHSTTAGCWCSGTTWRPRRSWHRRCASTEDRRSSYRTCPTSTSSPPIPSVTVPQAPIYVLRDLDRGDAMANWSPDEALPAIEDAGRTPLTLSRGSSLASATPRGAGARALLHDDRLSEAQVQRRPRRPHTRRVDQQRHRTRWCRQPRRTQSRLVLGGQSPHLVGLCLSE